MNNKILKNGSLRLLSVLIIICILLSTTFISNGAANTDVEISSYGQSEQELQEGEEFTLTLTVRNNDGTNITNVYAIINQSSAFYVTGGSNQNKVADTINSNGGTDSTGFNLTYAGGSNALSVTIKYTENGGGEAEKSQTLYLSTKEEISSNSSPSTTDTSKYEPNLIADFTEMPELTAGKYNNFKIPIKNLNGHNAKDVSISLNFDASIQDAITIEDIRFNKEIASIQGFKSEEPVFKFYIKNTLESGTYPITINYSYKNAFGNSFTKSDSIYVKVTNSTIPIILEAKSITLENPGVPGDINHLIITLSNNGSLSAKDVSVTIDSIGKDVMQIYNDVITQKTDLIFPKSDGQIIFPVMLSNDAKTGNYPFTLTIDWTDGNGDRQSKKVTAYTYISLSSDANDSSIDISNISISKEKIIPGEDFTVFVTVKNTGKAAKQNVEVQMQGDSSILPTSFSNIMISQIEAGKSKVLKFKYMPIDKTPAGYYPMKIIVNATNSSGMYSQSRYTGVDIVSSSHKTTPKIIVAEYRYSVEKVTAGEAFDLIMTFFNTSKTSATNNIKVTITSTGDTFTPIESSNSFYIDNIEVDSKIEKAIKLLPSASATTGTYKLNVKLEYEGDELTPKDANDNVQSLMEEEILSIPIFQEPKLNVSAANIPKEASMGMPIKLTADFFNMGRSTLHNMLVNVEGEGFEGEDLSYFVGEFGQGSSDYIDARIFTEQEGEISGDIVFTFEDDSGSEFEIREPFVIMISNTGGMEGMKEGMPEIIGSDGKPVFNEINPDGSFDPMAPQSRINPFIKIIIIVVVVIVVIILIIFLKRRKKKKELLEDEEL